MARPWKFRAHHRELHPAPVSQARRHLFKTPSDRSHGSASLGQPVIGFAVDLKPVAVAANRIQVGLGRHLRGTQGSVIDQRVLDADAVIFRLYQEAWRRVGWRP